MNNPHLSNDLSHLGEFDLKLLRAHHKKRSLRTLAGIGICISALRVAVTEVAKLFWLKPIEKEEDTRVWKWVQLYLRLKDREPRLETLEYLRRELLETRIDLLNMQIINGLNMVECFARRHSIEELRLDPPPNLKDRLLEIFEESVCYMRYEIVVLDSDEHDLPIVEKLTPEEKLEERECQEVYDNEYLIGYGKRRLRATPEDQHSLGLRANEFYVMKQESDETMANFGIRICDAFRKAFPYENPMHSLSARQVFARGLRHFDDDGTEDLHSDVLAHRSLTFGETFNVMYLCDWLEKNRIPGLDEEMKRKYLNTF